MGLLAFPVYYTYRYSCCFFTILFAALVLFQLINVEILICQIIDLPF